LLNFGNRAMRPRTPFWGSTILFGLLLVASLAPSQTPRANVTLSRFVAYSLSGQPDIFIEWETATEFDTSGFYVVRSETAGPDSAYVRVSGFEPAQGDSITPWQYGVVDDTTVLNKLYYYKLEEIPSDQAKPSIFHGPVVIIAGMPDTPTSTSSPSLTPTSTRTPTPTTQSNQPSEPASPEPVIVTRPVTTPGLASGATVTPRPSAASSETGKTFSNQDATPLPTALANTDPPAPALEVTSIAAAQNTSTQPGSTAGEQSTLSQPAVMGTPPAEIAGVPVAVAPIVIPSEAPETEPATSHPAGGLWLLVGAALLLLGGGLYVIYHQTSK
jgi:hypothetical protein